MVAPSIATGLDHLRRSEFEAALLDLMLRDASGIDILTSEKTLPCPMELKGSFVSASHRGWVPAVTNPSEQSRFGPGEPGKPIRNGDEPEVGRRGVDPTDERRPPRPQNKGGLHVN